MRIAIGCDHAGVELKRLLISSVLSAHNVIDVGIDCMELVDYPDVAKQVADKVITLDADRGILICGTGIGMAMAAGRFSGIRAATCSDIYSAEMSRRHNDANILCLGARVVGAGVAEGIARMWLSTPFDGGRHKDRVSKIEQNLE
jgi:ribose 5-phosphate isomerase B